jgi:hypothetical protein
MNVSLCSRLGYEKFYSGCCGVLIIIQSDSNPSTYLTPIVTKCAKFTLICTKLYLRLKHATDSEYDAFKSPRASCSLKHSPCDSQGSRLRFTRGRDSFGSATSPNFCCYWGIIPREVAKLATLSCEQTYIICIFL